MQIPEGYDTARESSATPAIVRSDTKRPKKKLDTNRSDHKSVTRSKDVSSA
jgi:hypothetical protein